MSSNLAAYSSTNVWYSAPLDVDFITGVSISILSFLHPELKTSLFSYGELFGKIINSPRGKGGFGYDPIFQIKNSKLTLAEISEEKRMRISHRTVSTLKMINLLNESKM